MKKLIIFLSILLCSTCYADKASYEAELARRKELRISKRIARGTQSKNVRRQYWYVRNYYWNYNPYRYYRWRY